MEKSDISSDPERTSEGKRMVRLPERFVESDDSTDDPNFGSFLHTLPRFTSSKEAVGSVPSEMGSPEKSYINLNESLRRSPRKSPKKSSLSVPYGRSTEKNSMRTMNISLITSNKPAVSTEAGPSKIFSKKAESESSSNLEIKSNNKFCHSYI